jgi:hypothetical protein
MTTLKKMEDDLKIIKLNMAYKKEEEKNERRPKKTGR